MTLEARSLIDQADRLLTRAETAQMNDDHDEMGRLAFRAQRLRRKAFLLMPKDSEGRRDRLSLLKDYLFTADAMEDQKRMVWAVREAVECDPDEDTLADLRDYWESASWVLRGDKSFPVPVSDQPKPWAPAPGQMSFLEDDE